MSRFDVYKYDGMVPLLMDIQADLLSDLKTRVVIPLMPESKAREEAAARLKPIIKVDGKKYILMTTDIGTVRLADLGIHVTNIEDQRQTIVDAVDFLLQGF